MSIISFILQIYHKNEVLLHKIAQSSTNVTENSTNVRKIALSLSSVIHKRRRGVAFVSLSLCRRCGQSAVVVFDWVPKLIGAANDRKQSLSIPETFSTRLVEDIPSSTTLSRHLPNELVISSSLLRIVQHAAYRSTVLLYGDRGSGITCAALVVASAAALVTTTTSTTHSSDRRPSQTVYCTWIVPSCVILVPPVVARCTARSTKCVARLRMRPELHPPCSSWTTSTRSHPRGGTTMRIAAVVVAHNNIRKPIRPPWTSPNS
jgi:hypothetical protein